MYIKSFLLSILLMSCASYKGEKKFKVQEDIAYGDHKDQVADLYQVPQENAPIVVVIHGGGWSGRDKYDMYKISESLATHGYNVFNINYRLAPEFHHPTPIEDLALAIKYLKENYSDNFDFNNLALWGYSSGAHTALSYGLKEDNHVKAIVSGSGPYDLTWWPESPIVTPYMGYKFDENVKGWFDASPINDLTKNSPALFLYHGEEDRLIEHSQMTALEARAKLLGIDIETHSVYFWGHAGTFIFSSESVEKAVHFLEKRLN